MIRANTGRWAWMIGLLWIVSAQGATPAVPAPGPRDTCPVCGMFVARYPEWIATVVYKDGHAHHFDGAKDLFKFLLKPSHYAPGHYKADIVTQVVTEYYGLTLIDAAKALYVIGSDVLGPMGHEFIPFASRADAEEFMRDHKGRRIVTYQEIGAALLEKVDNGRFD